MSSQLQLIAPENKSADHIEHRSHNLRALTAALGDGRDWEYTGNCSEDRKSSGVCACGHSGLRFLFLIRNVKTSDTKIVGSSCINHFQDANPKLVEAIHADVDRLRKESADRLKAAKALAAESEISGLLATLSSHCWSLAERVGAAVETFEYRHYNGHSWEWVTGYKPVRRVSYELWRAGFTPDVMARHLASRRANPDVSFPLKLKAYKSRSAFKKAIEAKIAEIVGFLSRQSFQ